MGDGTTGSTECEPIVWTLESRFRCSRADADRPHLLAPAVVHRTDGQLWKIEADFGSAEKRGQGGAAGAVPAVLDLQRNAGAVGAGRAHQPVGSALREPARRRLHER